MIITVITVTSIIILLSLSLLLLELYSSLMKYRTIETSFYFWTVTQNFILKTKKKKKKKKNVWRCSDFHCTAVISKVTIWELFHFPSDCFVNYNLMMIFLKVVAAVTDEEAASYLHFFILSQLRGCFVENHFAFSHLRSRGHNSSFLCIELHIWCRLQILKSKNSTEVRASDHDLGRLTKTQVLLAGVQPMTFNQFRFSTNV